ncbi:MAG: TIGR03557 family F420-dependent LLM class oxidoreductase [Acidimicrobiia bacterium]
MTRFGYFCGHEQFHPEELVRHAVLAEQAGFDLVVVSEHFHPWVDDLGTSGYAFATLGAMAQVTERVELVTGVTTPLFRHHPAVVAQAAATLDRLSGGRFQLGVGTGENLNEGPLGFPFPRYAERAGRMEEALQIMRGLLDGDKVSFDGEYYQTDRARLYSLPVGRVPIWMAAGGPKSAALAAQRADGLITSVKVPAETRQKVLEPALLAAREAGRPAPPLLATRWSVYAESAEDAFRALGAWRGLRAPGRLDAVDPADLRERADEMDRAEILSMYSVVHSAADYVATYAPLIESGAEVVTIQTTSLDQESVIKLLGNDVLPRLRDLALTTDH